MLLALAFVPKNNILEIYEKLKFDYSGKLDGKAEISVFNYFERNFLNDSNISEWGCEERVLKDIPLTTNVCEGFNRALKLFLKAKHPSLTKLIIILRTQDYIQDKDINDAILLRPISSVKKKTQKK
ncbi:hypothetical protein DMUE_3683, partial [Dictyocoela muelleri]